MIILKEKADKAREEKQKFMNSNRRDTHLKANWPCMENIPLDLFIAEDYLIHETKKELDKVKRGEIK